MQLSSPKVRRRALKSALVFSGVMPAVLFAVASRVHAQTPKIDLSDFLPQATIVEIMDSMVMPSAQVLWDAVAVDVTENGTVEKVPQTDDDWAKLRWTAVTLAEATNALVVPGRHVAPAGTKSLNPEAELEPEQVEALLAKDRPAFVAHAHVLHEAAMEALRAIDAKNIDAISEAGGTIDAACEGCHLQFWYPNQK
jgi:cytochrome c556